MERIESKDQAKKNLERQAKQKARNTKIKGLKVEKGKQLLKPGREYMVGAENADVLVKAGRAEIVK